MYNAEKYIGDCLDSIFAQTLQDYEVIIVDDCSTDNSRAIVESYLPKFNAVGGGGKLRLIRLNKNSGNPAAPTNKGIELSRGEYLLLMDNDDLLKNTALEELYSLAKHFNADVVHCERYFQFNDGEKILTLAGYQRGELIKEPTFLTNNLLDRINELCSVRFLWNLWSKLIRRDFLIEKNIKLVDVMAQDVLFTWYIVLTAPRYLRVPNIINFYRMRNDSLFHKQEPPEKIIHMRVYAALAGFKHFKKFLNDIEFFKNRPDVKSVALESWTSLCCSFLMPLYKQIPAYQIYELIGKELEQFENSTDFTAFLFSRMNVLNVQISHQGNIIQQMNAYIQQQQEQIKKLQGL